jgi:hypothetical protein
MLLCVQDSEAGAEPARGVQLQGSADCLSWQY